jgi:uncharacterized protein
MSLIDRAIDRREIQTRIESFPVTAILGPRQIGKTTIAREFGADYYFDLENPRDQVRLDQPQLALEDLKGLIVIDEIQRLPDLFPLIRYLVDNIPEQKYLILGSASRDLIRQSSESLAGRIAYFHLAGFRLKDTDPDSYMRLWCRGGFPDSFLSMSDDQSLLWRENFISTFLERDIPQLGITIPARTLRRFWSMLAHYHSQVLNHSELGRSFGVSDVTVRKYVDILEGTFMVRILQPWYANIGKRLVKRPKIYLRDSGVFHALMNIENPAQLLSHPKLGASWEGFALECISRSLGKPDNQLYFWRTHTGSELDLFWQHRGRNWGIEVKYADAPRTTKSMRIAMEDLSLHHLWIIYPGTDRYRLTDSITVMPLTSIPDSWAYELE